MEKITSVQNIKIKNLSKLMSSSKHRHESGAFVMEGLRLCLDILNSEYELCEVYVTSEVAQKYSAEIEPLLRASAQCFEISDEISTKVSDTKNSQGIFCVCNILDKLQDIYKIDFNGKYIVLEQIADPSNLGAVCRTAEALGISGVIVCGGCDIYSPKVQRASMGSLLRIPVMSVENVQNFIKSCRQNGMKSYASTPKNDATDILKVEMSAGTLCVVGNEASGVTQQTMEVCDDCITIKMLGRAESLNAAAAASIIMWEMMK
ncbi:MAG: RNA methyltransferase [Oscillospiraceae bacterium]